MLLSLLWGSYLQLPLFSGCAAILDKGWPVFRIISPTSARAMDPKRLNLVIARLLTFGAPKDSLLNARLGIYVIDGSIFLESQS